MRPITRVASLLFFVAVLPVAAMAQPVPACAPNAGQGGILTGLAHQFSNTTGAWMNTALHYAQGLFFALVGIEIAWSAITYVLQKDSLPDFVASLLLKILGIGFFYILLQPQYGPVWIADIISSFSQAGSAIGGQSQLMASDPSSVFNCGTDIANAMLQSISENKVGLNLGNILPAIEAVLASMICSLGVVIAFAIVAGQLLITLIESYIVVGAGVFMLGFTGSRWTLVFGEKYVGYAVSVGIKLFMLELIVGLGYSLGQQWAALFYNGIAPPETYIEVVGAALVFGFLAWQIPSLAASLMNGAPRMTLGSFVNTAGAVAVGSVIAGSSVGGIVAGARAVSSSNTDTVRAAGDVGDASSARLLDTGTAARGNGRGSGEFANAYDTDAYAHEPERSARPSSSEASAAAEEADASAVEAADESDSASGDDGLSGEPRGPTEAEIEAEESAETRASDAAVSADDARATAQAEQHDVGTGGSSSTGINPMIFRQPPVPDDAADGNIEIRFKHPK
ncbi:MAG: P-type conjugative transfer protein TrbL [Candidatus Eremiobacteraeota bacterium]|nr:P-type conjugative transfer protein TrbL [Candidatus Eremiobacteraeota bacterium]